MSDSAAGPTDSFRQRRWQRPRAATEVLLVRHGASAPFVPGQPFPLKDGHGDPALAPEGLRQAEQVADRLETENVAAIYVSSLQRTHQTAAPLAARLGLEPTIDPDLREVFLGEWEGGLFRQRLREGHPAALAVGAEQRWDAVPGAESNTALAARTSQAVQRVADTHPGELAVVVCHGGVIGALLGHALGVSPFEFNGADNASISSLVIHGDRWSLRRFNDSAHVFRHIDSATNEEL